jgi:hypothetical protein
VIDEVVNPTATGSKTTCTVQELPAATLAPQVVEPTEKLAAPTPPIEKLGCPSAAPPLFEIVSVKVRALARGTLISSPPNEIMPDSN